ncbi:hypothetical protein Aduo_001884 [Ancylostoma duodenale]
MDGVCDADLQAASDVGRTTVQRRKVPVNGNWHGFRWWRHGERRGVDYLLLCPSLWRYPLVWSARRSSTAQLAVRSRLTTTAATTTRSAWAGRASARLDPFRVPHESALPRNPEGADMVPLLAVSLLLHQSTTHIIYPSTYLSPVFIYGLNL